MPDLKPLLIALCCILFNTNLLAAECRAKSGKQVLPLLELYTSEGCSSCPPADQWLRALKLDDTGLIALAFHVDYWDYIGWKDRFAKASFSQRQRQSAAQGGLGFVYTPQFMLNGRDFRSWNEARLKQGIASISEQIASVALSLSINAKTNDEILMSATAQSVRIEDNHQTDVYVALYESNLTSTVTAGENMGRTLQHDYVVRTLFGPYSLNNNTQLNKAFLLKPEWKARNAGAVIFAQNRHSGEILQSLRLPLCQ